MAGNLFIIYFF